ncbi:MAG: type I pantothenate kinase [Candidatus Thermoplasmatota archaeon]|nr:type I pantothenate kinase [Candidatus Thermoplasmatota archaeon]
MLKVLSGSSVSPYISFNRKEWSDLRNSTPMTVSEEDLATIRGINEKISIKEVEEVYLPLSRLLNLYYCASRGLYDARKTFLGESGKRVPYVIGIAGSVAVGKSTTGRLLKTLISRWPSNPNVELMATDGFLLPNRILEERNLMSRKGFPESYDLKSLIHFLYELKSGKRNIRVPVYSHLIYDIVPDEFQTVDQPDILILEGLNVLQTRHTMAHPSSPELLVSDFFDFSIYVDAVEDDIKKWYIDRFLVFKETAFKNPKSFFRKYGDLSIDEAVATASRIWDEINGVNLLQNIGPSKFHAHLILRKGVDHAVTDVYMRKL